MHTCLIAALLLAAPSGHARKQALVCVKVTRTIEVLGWTDDGSAFVWRVTQREEDGDLLEVTHVSSTVVGHAVYGTKLFKKMITTPPDLRPADEWKAWQATHKLVKASTSVVSPTDKTLSLKVLLADKPMTPKGNEYTDAKPSKPPDPFVLGVTSTREVEPRRWKSDVKAPGCAHVVGYWSPDGNFVAWLTGSAKETCGEDPDCPQKCCLEPQVLLLRAH
jgi:hypothetical protein